MKPTPKQRRLLERLVNGPKLRVQIEGSGRSVVPNAVLKAGWAKIDDDPSVKDQWGYPAPSYFITKQGLDALMLCFLGPVSKEAMERDDEPIQE
jgi:hypothetical protein